MESEPTFSPAGLRGLSLLRAPCSLWAAICLLAREPFEEPEDPCAAKGALEGFPQLHTSRWLLTFLPAMQALAEGRRAPSAPESWRMLEPRLGFRTSSSLWPFDLDQIWRERIDSMRGHRAASGRTPAAWVALWAPYQPDALAHFEACERRNQNLLRGGEELREAVMRADGPLMCGRDTRARVFGEIQRALLYDPRAHWEIDASANLYENRISFTGRLRTPAVIYDDVSFAAADIAALVRNRHQRAQPHTGAIGKRTKIEAARQAALTEFPDGPPAGMSAAKRNDRINARLLSMGSAKASERTIRAALSGLWPIG